MRRLLPLVFLVGCTTSTPPARAPAATSEVTEGAPREELPWATFSPATFARAKAERKFIVLDGSAEWCHWCHVMEATTYHDPAVRALLDRHFITVKVDIDSRPDLAERYGDYGWPATVVFSPDATELGKYRGYLAPEKFAAILAEVVGPAGAGAASAGAGGDPGRGAAFVVGASRPAPRAPLPEEQLAWIAHYTELELDDYWDETEGSWGRQQKAALGWDNEWLLTKAARGDALARTRILFTLDRQAKLLDPVWGGIYQYSAARDWDHPHFEKLMTFQAAALDNYAAAYKLTADPKSLARARAMHGYIERFLKGPDGGFYTTQDADVNAHDRTKPFVDGHDYYPLDEAARLARGVPRVDTSEYGRENGLAIAAYATLYEATRDPAVLASAQRAAGRILATHRAKSGGITHGPASRDTPLFLSDNAAFGWGLVRLSEATHDARWKTEAKTIADVILASFTDEEGGGLFASTRDPDAVGVFATRRVPFEDNVLALRLLARVGAPRLAVGRILRAISVPEEIKGRGRWLGDYLLALEETKGAR